MRKPARFLLGMAVALSLSAMSARAATIIKLDLGGIGPDLQMGNSKVISTVNDGNAGSAGDQNTSVQFTGFLEPFPDINTNTASFSLGGLSEVGPALLVGNVIVQNFIGGQFSLFDSTNVLLLSGMLNASSLTGTFGPPATGSVFTTNFGAVTGGTLAPLIVPGSLSLSISLTNINGGIGLSVSSGSVDPFLAEGSLDISGDASAVPEPGSCLLILMGAGAGVLWRVRSRP